MDPDPANGRGHAARRAGTNTSGLGTRSMGGGILREARIAFSVIAVSEFGRHCERIAKAAQKGEKGLRDGGAGPARSMRQAQREYRPDCREFAAMCAGRGLPSS